MAKNKFNKDWLQDHLNDPYVKMAQREGYRARAAYKLKEINDYNLLNVAMPCQGNHIIAQKVIYNVNQQLKTKKSEEIIVGVMWSGVDRHNFFIDNNLRFRNTMVDVKTILDINN